MTNHSSRTPRGARNSRCTPGGLALATLVLGGLAAGPALAGPDAPSAGITPTAIASLKRVSEARISPDGTRVAYVVTGPDRPDRPGDPHVWLVRTGAPGSASPLPGAAAGDHDPRWSPDGTLLAFLDAAGRIRLFRPAGGALPTLGPLPGKVEEFRWSADGRRIAAIVHTDAPARAPTAPVEVDRPAGSSRLFLLPVAGGAAQALTGRDRFVFDVDWSADNHLVVRYGDGPGLDYLWYRSRVAILDDAGRLLLLLPHNATALHPRFSPDGRRVLYGYFAANGITGAVDAVSLPDGRATRLGGGWEGELRDVQWNPDGRALVGLGLSGTAPMFVRIDAATGAVSPLDRVAPQVLGDVYEFSGDRAGALCLAASSRTRPDEVWLFRHGEGRALTDSNPQVAGWRLGPQRVVRWRGRDGTALQGLLVLPPDAPVGARLPLVVQIHGGPLEAWTDGWLASWHDWARLLAAHGYAVFLPNPRGSAGRGDGFATAVVGDWGGVDHDDIIDGIVALEQQGVVDPARELIAGWSYGGFMSAWAAGHDTRFRAVIDGAGPTDLASMSLTTDVGYSFITPYFGDPIRKRAAYEAHSPLSFVHDVHVPVLILHGADDRRVPPSQAEMFYHALRDGGATVSFVRYPGAPHWFGGAVGADTQVDVQARVLDWVQRYLGR